MKKKKFKLKPHKLKKHKRKIQRDKEIANIKNNLFDHNFSIWLPHGILSFDHATDTHSWFDYRYTDAHLKHKITLPNIPLNKLPIISQPKNKLIKEDLSNIIYRSVKYTLILNDQQKKYLEFWFKAFVDIYNISIKYIKNNHNIGGFKLNKIYVRDNLIKEKHDIQIKYQINKENEEIKIPINVLDEGVKLAVSNYQSALTNKFRGRIKKFRIRYKKYKENNKILHIPANFIRKNSIYDPLFGKTLLERDGEIVEFPKIMTTSKVIYNVNDKKYYLIINERIKVKRQKTNKKVISLDPGIRTFLTGISENECIQMGSNLKDKIKPLLKRIDKLNRKKDGEFVIPKKIRKKREIQINRRIGNIIDDMQWKIISELTKKYSMILIGDMSTKSIVNNETGKISKMTKRIAYKMKLYTFRKRMMYKCHCKKIKYSIINERFTSKMCSHCGNVDDNLEGKKEYNCRKCEMMVDRDINGARNIYIKAWEEKNRKEIK